jgi:acetyltransferase-like isoleucine patch superfamily enzyme
MCYPENIHLKTNVFINRGAFITAPAPITIGTNALIGPYVVINSGSHVFEDPSRPIREQGHKEYPIVIEDDVWIGAHAYIGPNVHIGCGAVITANSVVLRNVAAYSVVAGIPATFRMSRGLPEGSVD